jgi:hypothetical protein
MTRIASAFTDPRELILVCRLLGLLAAAGLGVGVWGIIQNEQTRTEVNQVVQRVVRVERPTDAQLRAGVVRRAGLLSRGRCLLRKPARRPHRPGQNLLARSACAADTPAGEIDLDSTLRVPLRRRNRPWAPSSEHRRRRLDCQPLGPRVSP